MAVIAN